MFFSSVLLVGIISARINAVPLNINLGAYSPALVVGDGEISFRGKEEVSELMDALEGAAVSGAAKNGAAGGGTDDDTGEGLGVPQNSVTPGTPLQGMGKIITPRISNHARANDKRDINGFNAALSFASDSLSKGPAVELSTGPSGSGVGVRVNPKAAGTAKGNSAQISGPVVPQSGPKPRPQNSLGKREGSHQDESPKTETTVTKMLIRGGSSAEAEKDATVDRRSIPNTVSADSLNLSVADGQLAELTFVETRSVDEGDKNNN
ncbi:hypothetical protein HI914_06080 [Erysiphe necator]|uniref:Uncharacterized protein n=1 Tax=Uncinula necator TaxID=52586 RepID=A0A0B1PAU5_UNCNE|nr:hypothetical protein HI914_06080 [Erysiphe necator]KHJ35358.1 hypothetical protein EV44_g0473 [Erysiphe necator]